jgi:hypothetical protein
MTNILGQTTFVPLYQAGDGIYDLFDKVMVIDKGRQVYFGSASEARSYFEGLGYKSLPRQSTASYLIGCADPMNAGPLLSVPPPLFPHPTRLSNTRCAPPPLRRDDYLIGEVQDPSG